MNTPRRRLAAARCLDQSRWRCSIAALASALALAACGGAARPALQAPYPGFRDQRFVERSPAAYAPGPRPHAQSGGEVGLATSGAEEQARSTVARLLQALLDQDDAALYALLADRVVLVLSASMQARAEVIEDCLHDARALRYEPELHAQLLSELADLEVRSAARHHAGLPLPPGLLASDLVVLLPPPPSASEGLRRVPCLSGTYVRPGARASVVGLTR